MSKPRLFALKILIKVIQNKQAMSQAFVELNEFNLNQQDMSLAKNLCFTTMRNIFVLRQILHNQLLKKPLKTKHLDLEIIIYLGLTQIFWLKIPDHAALNETVKLAKLINKSWACKLINAVLRNAQRSCKNIDIKNIPSHPNWLQEKIKQAYPSQFMDILTANMQQAPMTLRLNTRLVNRSDFINRLPVVAHAQGKHAVVLSKPINIEQLQEYATGTVYVQDAGFQHAAELLNLKQGQRVLDACAAPGGKSTHILEIEPLVKLSVLEINPKRLGQIKDNLNRLKMTARIIIGDASKQDWWDGKPYDRILCDVPCSATGIIRRHPDIMFLRSPNEITKLIKIQAEILANCWQMLKAGGVLLYSTCSILAEENEQQIRDFIENNANAKIVTINDIPGKTLDYGVQALPTLANSFNNHDGYYYAKITKEMLSN